MLKVLGKRARLHRLQDKRCGPLMHRFKDFAPAPLLFICSHTNLAGTCLAVVLVKIRPFSDHEPETAPNVCSIVARHESSVIEQPDFEIEVTYTSWGEGQMGHGTRRIKERLH